MSLSVRIIFVVSGSIKAFRKWSRKERRASRSRCNSRWHHQIGRSVAATNPNIKLLEHSCKSGTIFVPNTRITLGHFGQTSVEKIRCIYTESSRGPTSTSFFITTTVANEGDRWRQNIIETRPSNQGYSKHLDLRYLIVIITNSSWQCNRNSVVIAQL